MCGPLASNDAGCPGAKRARFADDERGRPGRRAVEQVLPRGVDLRFRALGSKSKTLAASRDLADLAE